MMTLTPKSRIGMRPSLRAVDPATSEAWRTIWGRPSRTWTEAAPIYRPAMDVIEHEDGVTIRLDLPGVTPDEVTVEVEGDRLTISGELGHSADQEGQHYHRRERYAGAFKRSLQLAETLDTNQISATFENGVLTLELPKRPETQPKRIKVETL